MEPNETDANIAGEASSPASYEGVDYDAFPTSETNDNSPDLGNGDEEAANALNAGGEDNSEADSGQEPQSFAPVPYDRFKQKNEEWKTAKQQAEELQRERDELRQRIEGYEAFDPVIEAMRPQMQTRAEVEQWLRDQAEQQTNAQLSQLAVEDVNKEIDAGLYDGEDEDFVKQRRDERYKVRQAEQWQFQQQEQNRLYQEQQQAQQIKDTLTRQIATWKGTYPNLDEKSVTHALYATGDWNQALEEAKRTHNRNLVAVTNNPPQSTAPRNAAGVAAPTPMGAGNSAGVTKPDEWTPARVKSDPKGWDAHVKRLSDQARERKWRDAGIDTEAQY